MSDPYKILFASRHFYLDRSNGGQFLLNRSYRSLRKEGGMLKRFAVFSKIILDLQPLKLN